MTTLALAAQNVARIVEQPVAQPHGVEVLADLVVCRIDIDAEHLRVDEIPYLGDVGNERRQPGALQILGNRDTRGVRPRQSPSPKALRGGVSVSLVHLGSHFA